MPEVPRNSMTGQVTTKLGRVSMNPRGEYQGGETYARLDIVQYNGSGWVCRKDNTAGIAPVEGDNWMRFADNGSATMYQEIQTLAAQVQADKTASDKSATEAAESASQAKSAADTAVSDAEAQLQEYVDAAETAQTDAQTARTAAEAARGEAQTASTSASEKAAEAAQSADTAKQYSGNPPIIGEDDNWQTWDAEAGEYTSTDKPSRGVIGPQGEPGVSPSVSVERQGKTTTVTITDAEGPHPFNIEDGKDGTGTGDMEKSVYDKKNQQKDIYEAIDEAVKNVKIDMDAVPTESSQNAVQSGGVYTALAGKQDKLTFDDVPTENSANPVKSGGVYDALQRKPNPNLLDNWYFVGGGSQQGGGQFPINQRGNVEYTEAGYAIDRWLYSTESVGNKFVIENDCVRITGGNIAQRLPILSDVKGKTMTFSVLMSDNVLHSITGTFPAVMSGVSSIVFDGTLQIGYDTRINLIYVTVVGTYGCVAAKLELGSQQTLAHKEGDTWVLNEIPDYRTELAKCQRYMRNINGIYPAFADYDETGIGNYIFVTIPNAMRIAPVILNFKVFWMRVAGQQYQGDATLESTIGLKNENSTSFSFRMPGVTGLQMGQAAQVVIETGILDANL